MNIAAGEEVGPKLVRLLYFVGAGFLCTAAINKWKALERKAAENNNKNVAKQQEEKSAVCGGQILQNSPSNSNVVN